MYSKKAWKRQLLSNRSWWQTWPMVLTSLWCSRYNCNRYNEDDAKAARDAQEVMIKVMLHCVSTLKRTSSWLLHTEEDQLAWNACRVLTCPWMLHSVCLNITGPVWVKSSVFELRLFQCFVTAALQGRLAEVPVLLQPLHEPHAEPALWAQALRSGQAENGGDAAAQHVLDRGAVPEEGCGRAVPVPLNAHVHIRLCLLPQEEQPIHYFWGRIRVIIHIPFTKLLYETAMLRLLYLHCNWSLIFIKTGWLEETAEMLPTLVLAMHYNCLWFPNGG